jgi:hypothetical protein
MLVSVIKSLIHLLFGWVALIGMFIKRVLVEKETEDKTEKIKKATTGLWLAVVSFILTLILIKVTFLGENEIFFNQIYKFIFANTTYALWQVLK